MSPVCSGCRFRRGSPVLLAPCASAFFLAAVPWFRVCLSIFSLDKKHRRARPSRKVGRPTTVVAIRKGCSNSVCRLLLFFWPAGRRAAKPGDAGEGVRSKGPTVRDADAGIWPYVLYVCCSLLDRPVQLRIHPPPVSPRPHVRARRALRTMEFCSGVSCRLFLYAAACTIFSSRITTSWALLLFKKPAPSSRVNVETKKFFQHPAHPERTQSGFAPRFLLWSVIYPFFFLCSVVLNLAALSPPAIPQHLTPSCVPSLTGL